MSGSTSRAIASLTDRVGKSSTFLIFSSNFAQFSLFSSNFTYFLPHFSPPRGRLALATPLSTSTAIKMPDLKYSRLYYERSSINFELHFFPNPQIFLHVQRELYCNNLPINISFRNSIFLGKEIILCCWESIIAGDN